MEFIKEFIEKALNEKQSFLMKKDEQYISFFQNDIGAARYIFAVYNFWNKDVIGLSDLDLEPKVIAIVANDLVYILDPYFFDVYPESGRIPDESRMAFFSDICQNAQKQIQEEIFPNLFENLVLNRELDKNELEMCRQRARDALLKGDDFSYDECDIELSKSQIAQTLCGFSTVAELAEDMFWENVDKYRTRKAYMQTTISLLESQDIVEDWEQRLANGLHSVDAKTVTVEFTFNGKTASAKIEPNKILYKLTESEYFNDYDFVTSKSGEQLFKELNASNRWDKEQEALTCKHITKIKYNREVLFTQ